MNKDVQDYIKKMREGGKKDDEIKNELLKAGWGVEEIDLPDKNKTQLDKKIDILYALFIIGDGILITGFYLLWPFLEYREDSSLGLDFFFLILIFSILGVGGFFSFTAALKLYIKNKKLNIWGMILAIPIILLAMVILITIFRMILAKFSL